MKNLLITAAIAFALLGIGKFVGVKATTSHANSNAEACLPNGDSLAAHIEKPDGTAGISEIGLLRSVVCEAIEHHNPVKAATEFEVGVGKIWVFSEVKMKRSASGTLRHIYFLDGKKMSEVTLEVKGPTFRTFSYKTLTPKMTGEWKVEIRTGANQLLETQYFSVVP